MKKLLLLIVLLLTTFFAQAQAPYFSWAKSLGGPGAEEGRGIAVDGLGNVYTIGNFTGTADFDPGPNSTTLTSAGDTDVYVSKLDSSGNFVWAVSLGGAQSDVGHGIAVDVSGNVYTTGYYSGTADFDPGANVMNLVSNGGFQDIFVCKLNTLGVFQWARSIGGTSVDEGWGIAVDAAANVYFNGMFSQTADFDPGASVQNLTAAGSTDAFVAKFDTNGLYLWANDLGGTSNELSESIAVNASGVYTTGAFSGTADFDPSGATYNLTALAFKASFVSKLDTSGNFVWAKQFDGGGFSEGTGIALDPAGNVYSTGLMNGTIDFDPSGTVQNLTAQGGLDGYVSKLTADGDYVWAKRIGGNQNDYANSIAVDVAGSVYTTGFFGDIVDFDPGTGTHSVEYLGYSDCFVSKLDTDGAFAWTAVLAGTNDEMGRSVAVDAAGSIYTTGYYNTTVDFDPAATIYNLVSSANSSDAFVHKMNPTALAINTFAPLSSIMIYPNPSKGNFTIQGGSDIVGSNVSVFNLLGQKVKEIKLDMMVNGQNLDKGIYLLEIEKDNGKVLKKVIVN